MNNLNEKKTREELIKTGGDKFRIETLLPFNAGWVCPNTTEIGMVLRMGSANKGETHKITKDKYYDISGASSYAGVSLRTVSKWNEGETPISYPSWCLLVYRAGLGMIAGT